MEGINQRNIYCNRIRAYIVFSLSCNQKQSKKQDRVRNLVKRNSGGIHTPRVVKYHEDTQDGHKVWKDLIEWYDREDVVAETAETTETLRQKLHDTCMVSGVRASTYINQFLTTYNELEKLKGHGMNDQETNFFFFETYMIRHTLL